MAAPIAHIYLALQVLAGPLKGHFNEKEFLIGTSFPDIRYLKLVERAQTHFENVSFEDIKKEKNSFKAGMLFHSLVDEKREEYMVKNNMYAALPKFRFVSQSLKFAEDEILRTQFDVQKHASLFDEILAEERAYKISDENIHTWHSFLKEYLATSVSCHAMLMRYFNLHEPDSWFIKRWIFSVYYARKMSSIVEAIAHDKKSEKTKSLILDFYTNFTDKLQSH